MFLIAFLSLIVVAVCTDVHVRANRAIAFNRVKQGAPPTLYGSRGSNLRGIGYLADTSLDGPATIFVRLSDLKSEEQLEQLLAGAQYGIVFITSGERCTSAPCARLYEKLMYTSFPHPIYFLSETGSPLHSKNVTDLLGRLATGTFWSFDAVRVPKDQLTLAQLPAVEPIVITGTLFGEQEGKDPKKKSSSKKLPTIVVSADMDTFGPALGELSSEDSSSVAILMELAGVFKEFYGRRLHPPPFNIAFVLASGARLGYLGTKNWLSDLDDWALQVEFALCLEHVSQSDPNGKFYLHASRPEKDKAAKQMYSAVSSGMSDAHCPLETLIRKINVSQTEMKWGHEHYAYKKIIAGTISSFRDPPPQLLRSVLAPSFTSVEQQRRLLESIALSLVNYMGLGAETETVKGIIARLPLEDRLKAWQDFHLSHPRNLLDPVAFAQAVETYELELAQALGIGNGKSRNTVQKYQYTANDFVFFGPVESNIRVYPQLSFFLELPIIVCILAAVVIAVSSWIGWDATVATLRSFF